MKIYSCETRRRQTAPDLQRDTISFDTLSVMFIGTHDARRVQKIDKHEELDYREGNIAGEQGYEQIFMLPKYV